MFFASHYTEVRRRQALAALGVVGVGLASLGVGGLSVESAPALEDETVQILSFNDYHGHVEDDTPGTIDGSFDGPKAGGAEYLSAKLTELRQASTADNTYTVAAGDLIGGSPYFSGLFHDEPSVESLNAMGLDYSGVGNHEFDEGVVELMRMQKGGCHPDDGCYFTDYDAATPGDQEFAGASNFEWLAANVTEDAPDGTDDFEDTIADWAIETTAGGSKIAFIGMTLEGTDELVAPAGIIGFTFEDEIAAATQAVADIKASDASVESMVLMLHEGGLPTPFAINGCAGISGPIVTIAEGLDSEIDAIVTGHTHQPYTCSFDDPDDNPRPVVSAWSFGRVVTELMFDLDGATGELDRTTFTMTNHPVLQSDLTADAVQTAILAKWAPLAEAIGNSPIGNIAETITRGGDPTGSDRGVESSAGNLVADAQLAATAQAPLSAEIAFMNPGGLRSDLTFESSDKMEGDGVVTYGEAFTFQPFNNTMFVLEMTGAQIVSVLEEQCQPGDSSRPVLHLGVSDGFTYDLAITTQGGVCTAVEVSNVKLGGTDIDPAATYNVAVNNFLADGGDNFDTFAEVAQGDRKPGPQDIDALNEYLLANSPVEAPGIDRVNETPTVLPGPTTSLTPARLLETRVGDDKTTVDGEFEGEGPNLAGGTVELIVADRGGVSSDASAVLLNIAVIRPDMNGFLTAYPCGTDRPLAANANYAVDAVVSNAVLAKVGEDGKVCIYTDRSADLTADVVGFVPASGSPSSLEPARLLETRTGPDAKTVDGSFQGQGPIAGGETLKLEVADRGGVAEDAKAVMMNVAAINPLTNGFLTIYACDVDRPNAASVNFAAGAVRSNSVTSGIGIDGDVCVYASQTVEVAIDVNGYVPVDGSPDPLEPARIVDTRVGTDFKTVDGEFEGEGPVQAGKTLKIDVAGRGGVAADATTVVLNIATVGPEGPGFATAYPCDEDRPNAANVNYAGSDVNSNAVVAKIDQDGKVCVYTFAKTDLVVDVTAAVPVIIPARPAE